MIVQTSPIMTFSLVSDALLTASQKEKENGATASEDTSLNCTAENHILYVCLKLAFHQSARKTTKSFLERMADLAV